MANMMAWLANHPRVLPERLIRGAFLAAADIAWLLRVGSVRQLERNLSHVLAWSASQPEAAGVQPAPVDAKALRRMSHRGMRSYFTYFSEALTVGRGASASSKPVSVAQVPDCSRSSRSPHRGRGTGRRRSQWAIRAIGITTGSGHGMRWHL